MQPRIKSQDETSGFYLYSFAPASGVGFYLTKDDIVKFDLVTKEQSSLKGTTLIAQRAEFDQVDAEAYFTSYEELVSFASKEYLRDKKNTLYALLLTRDLGEELNIKTLQLLNESGFDEVKFSERAIPIFNEIAKGQRVSSVVQLAYDLGLKNVQGCLGNELSTLTFDTVRSMIDKAQHTDLARERVSLFENTLGLLRNYVFAVTTVPGFAYQSIMAFCNYAEGSVASLSAKGIDALSSLLTKFERASPMVNYAQAIAFNEPRLISETFTSALFQSEAQTVTALSARLSELAFSLDEELAATGRRFLDLALGWGLSPFGFVLVSVIADEDTRELLRSVAREVYVSQRHQTKFNRTRSNFLYSIDFELPDKLFRTSQESDQHLGSLSFWLAFYADSDRVFDPWYPFPPRPHYRSLADLFFYTTRRSDAELSDTDLLYAYNASNLFSLLLMDPETFYESEARDIVSQLVTFLYEIRDTRQSQPFDLLVSNLLAWALQTRQEKIVNQIIAYIRDRRHEELTLSPFIRIIL